MTYVYWIHTPNHTDIFSEGYIGVSNRLDRRLYEHKWCKQNPHLTNAFNKYKDIVHTILIQGPEAYCYDVESKLRPDTEIGWNINKGGAKPPSSKGLKRSIEHKDKIRQSRYLPHIPKLTGKTNPNWGKGAAKGRRWYYDPLTKYSSYYVPNTQPDGWIAGRYSRNKIECQ